MTYRVLVVEDSEPWRRYVSSALRHTPHWQIIGEALDGLDAVQKAQELKPELILLDVGLPILNGIEAARRILAQDPNSRILFVSEHRSWDVAEAALGTGAQGYIVKSDAGAELLHAMEAIVASRRFISARLGGRGVETPSDQRVTTETRRHEVGFYSDEASLLDAYAGFAEAALAAGKALIVLVSHSRRDTLHARLQARGVDVDCAIREGRYASVDPATALSRYMVDGWPHEAQFWNAATSLIMGAARAAKGERPRVAACGECAPHLVREGRTNAAIRLEQLWDEVARTYDVDILCGYSLDVPRFDEGSRVFQDICAVHSAVRS